MVKTLENESIEDLQINGLKLLQKKDGFRFGVDAVLLSDFADVRKNDRVIDLGTGTGIITILLSAKTAAKEIVGLELQTQMAEMAQRSVLMNNLKDKIEIICGDICKIPEMFGSGSFNSVVSNPPYMNNGGGILNPSDTKAIARHEIACTLEDVIKGASHLLCPSGKFAMVHRPERLADAICFMRKYYIEPKYLRFIHPAPYKKPAMILLKGTKGGKPQLKVMEPLYVHDLNGEYSSEINRIYGREKIQSEG